MSVWIGMTGGMDEHWGEKELPRVGHQLASCSLIKCYILMFTALLILSKQSNAGVNVYLCPMKSDEMAPQMTPGTDAWTWHQYDLLAD